MSPPVAGCKRSCTKRTSNSSASRPARYTSACISEKLSILSHSAPSTSAADAGSLYLVERGKEQDSSADDQLRFKLTQNDSVVVPFEEFTMPLSKLSIAGYVALSGHPLNVADAYHVPSGSTYQISRTFDEKSGYRTKSMLVVPMRDHQEKVIGVVQLINKKRDAKAVLQPVTLVEELVIPFTAVDEELVKSLASQAAVAFENAQLIDEIKTLFNAFVDASVTAVEQRDPTTSGHSRRVAELMGREKAWDEDRIEEEARRYEEFARR